MAGSISHTTHIRVRYADTDKMGVVYNGNYFQYFEIGRTEMLRAAGLPYSTLESEGFMLPVLEAHAEYLKPATYDDLLEVTATYEDLPRAVIKIDYEVSLNGHTLVRGYTRHSFVDAGTWKPVRPPKVFREAITNALAESTQ